MVGTSTSSDDDALEIAEIAAMIDVSPELAQKLLDRAAIPAWVEASGQQFAWRRDVIAWREQRERQRETLRELANQGELIDNEHTLPNAATVRALRDAEIGRVTRSRTVDELFTQLDATGADDPHE